MIYSGIGYLVNHVVSNKFAIYIALRRFVLNMNYPVTGSIMVTAFRI